MTIFALGNVLRLDLVALVQDRQSNFIYKRPSPSRLHISQRGSWLSNQYITRGALSELS